jgi:hypothetical protein
MVYSNAGQRLLKSIKVSMFLFYLSFWPRDITLALIYHILPTKSDTAGNPFSGIIYSGEIETVKSVADIFIV